MMLEKKRILTGDRPTGSLHLGHYVGTLANRVRLQDEYECFFIVADYQVLTDHLQDTAKISQNVREIVLDWLSLGLDPEKSNFFVQSEIPEISELTMLFSMLVSVARLKRNPTVKDELKAANLSESEMTYGFLGYPISQAADIMIVRSHLVPVGADQLPHVEQTREIARTFNGLFGEVFPVPEPLIGQVARLPGIDGQKMSKSRNNAIFLKDTPEEVAQKVMRAYTDPTRIRATDPGHVEGNVVFAYLDAFHQNKKEVECWKENYRRGRIGDVALKKILINSLEEFLQPIRERRNYFASKTSIVEESLAKDIKKTRLEAKKTMDLVKQTMHLQYKKGML